MQAATKEETVGDLIDRLPPSEGAALALIPDTPNPPAVTEQPATLLAAIINASRDPSIDVAKLQALMTMQERLEERQAKREFIAAYSRLSGKLPRVKKNGTIDLAGKGSIPFAKWEDMDKIIRPLMFAEGFSLSFDSAPRTEQGGGLVVSGELMHCDGHSRPASIPLPLDTGPGRNNLQALGSTLSYGKRYVAEMLLNIVREGADDDGKTGDNLAIISDEQKAKLIEMMQEAEPDPAKLAARTKRFLKFFKIDAIDDLPASKFADARSVLQEQINANKKPTQP